jgi:hypothetical protein
MYLDYLIGFLIGFLLICITIMCLPIIICVIIYKHFNWKLIKKIYYLWFK